MSTHPDISFEQMKAFRAVAEKLSFSEAAKSLFRTQSAISIQVSKLEDNLDQKLFHRSTKHIEMTPAGEILLRYVERIFETVQEAQAAIRDIDQQVKGLLVISTSDTTACYRLPKIFQEYQQRYPDVDINIQNHTSPQTIEKVANNSVDIGIATIRNLPAHVSSKPLFQRKDVLICHPDHPLANRSEVMLKDLERYPMVLLDNKCSSRRLLDSYCEQAKVRLDISMELSSIEVVKSLVRINTGISIVPQISVLEDIRSRLLKAVEVRDIERQEKVQTGPIYSNTRYMSNATKAFLKLLEEY